MSAHDHALITAYWRSHGMDDVVFESDPYTSGMVRYVRGESNYNHDIRKTRAFDAKDNRIFPHVDKLEIRAFYGRVIDEIAVYGSCLEVLRSTMKSARGKGTFTEKVIEMFGPSLYGLNIVNRSLLTALRIVKRYDLNDDTPGILYDEVITLLALDASNEKTNHDAQTMPVPVPVLKLKKVLDNKETEGDRPYIVDIRRF